MDGNNEMDLREWLIRLLVTFTALGVACTSGGVVAVALYKQIESSLDLPTLVAASGGAMLLYFGLTEFAVWLNRWLLRIAGYKPLPRKN